jgi:flagellar hook assembly protein FlgD
MQSGSYSFLWDGKSNYGEPLPSGMYIYRLKSDSQQIAKKLILLR